MPHLAAIRMCASVTVVKQHQMYGADGEAGVEVEDRAGFCWGLHKETAEKRKRLKRCVCQAAKERLNDLVGVRGDEHMEPKGLQSTGVFNGAILYLNLK